MVGIIISGCIKVLQFFKKKFKFIYNLYTFFITYVLAGQAKS